MKELLKNKISDLLSNFFYYDRKEDDQLPVGEIQAWVTSGEITKEEIIEMFTNEINNCLK